MSEPFTFYRALDPVKGSWDGYGYFPLAESDFLAFVADAPSGASIHTPELIKNFWSEFCRDKISADPDQNRIELADGFNRLQDHLQKMSRKDGSQYQATLSLGLKLGSRLLYCSIGDSILQLYRNNKLYRLVVNEVWDGSFIIHENQQLKERQKTQTLRFIGNGGDFLEPNAISSFELQSDDVLIFCTDGVEDLLPPAQLIPLLKGKPELMRKEFERIFGQDKIKDDATFLLIKLEVPSAFDAEQELAKLQTQFNGLQKEQSQFRSDLTRVALPQARLDRIEKAIQDLAQHVQTLGKKADVVKPREPFRANQQNNQMPWMWLLIAFFAGLAVVPTGLFFAIRHPALQPATLPVTAQETAKPRTVAPPEIGSAQDCVYTVVKGDSLERIAAKKNLSMENLLLMNPTLKKETPLKLGQEIRLCGDVP